MVKGNQPDSMRISAYGFNKKGRGKGRLEGDNSMIIP